MTEYQEHLNYYSKESGWFSKTIPESQWGNIEVAKHYLEKYWLNILEYENFLKPIQDNIFINQKKGLPELLFAEDFEIIVDSSGQLFVREDFEKLKFCMQTLGDKYFVIITNTFGLPEVQPAFRLKYPTSISWEELNSGNFISSTIIESLYNEYFLFSESGRWGRYTANEYHYPVDIIGYKKECASVFQQQFGLSSNEMNNIRAHLPELYRQKLDTQIH